MTIGPGRGRQPSSYSVLCPFPLGSRHGPRHTRRRQASGEAGEEPPCIDKSVEPVLGAARHTALDHPPPSPAVCAVPRAAPAYMTRRQQPGDARCVRTNLPSAASRKGASLAPTSFLTPRRHWCHEEGRKTRHAQRTPDLKSIPMKTAFMEPRHDGRERR